MSDTSLPDATSGPELPAAGGPSDEQIRAAARIAGEHRVSRPGPQPDASPAGAERGRSPDRARLDFWEVLYKRRTTRRFDPARPVPREAVLELLDAALIAPTSCNLQMWDFVVVDDPGQREALGRLSLQVLTAPVSIFVAYGKEYSEEGHANVQSAAAALMNMSLAAHVLGLGTFWINQLGPRDQVGRILGLPPDREVVAALAVGWPKTYPTVAPRRRPFANVVHWNHFGGRPIPSSPRPADWSLDLIRDYQHARVLNGNRYNKPRAWDLQAALDAACRLSPRAPDDAAPAPGAPRWLDVLPVHGAFTAAMSRQHRDHRWAVLELSPEVAQFAAKRCPSQVDCEALVWDPQRPDALPAGAFGRITLINRLEALPPAERPRLLAALARALAPGGRLLLQHVSSRSFHALAQWLHARRGGPGGVEYVLAPDPNLGPWEALAPSEVDALLRDAGLRVVQDVRLEAAPSRAETDHRTRNMRGTRRALVRGTAAVARAVGAVPGIVPLIGRTRIVIVEPGHRLP
ncbi:MAG: methyltransferase domain-containing protein [Planctomycetes bacterium]|nr:methyltransferase domain-containing protein [Planctomycetota bacterium]